MTSIIPKISYLSNSVIRVLGCNPGPMTLQGTNTYIIGTGKRRVLFDTGEKSNAEYIKNLSGLLKQNDIKLDHIVISHWHHDHLGGLEEVVKLSKDATVMKYPRLDQPENIIDDISKKIQWLNGNEDICVEGASLKVIYTPGHSTDHVILKLEGENAVFSGDCILGEGTAVFEDLYDYMNSLQVILDCNPNVIYPGHGPIIEDPVPRIQYYINHRNEREKQIFEALKNNPELSHTAEDLVKLIYTDTPEHLHVAAANNVNHHLQKLLKEGRISRDNSVNDKVLWKYIDKPKM